jgi:hypothetical protein
MSLIFETPLLVALIILLCFLFFFVLLRTEFPRTNGKHQGTDTSVKVAEESSSECAMLGFLEKLPKGDPIPKECLNCRKLVECAMAKRAFDWYLGQNSGRNSENGRNNRTER